MICCLGLFLGINHTVSCHITVHVRHTKLAAHLPLLPGRPGSLFEGLSVGGPIARRFRGLINHLGICIKVQFAALNAGPLVSAHDGGGWLGFALECVERL
jgi:hypothetical protein